VPMHINCPLAYTLRDPALHESADSPDFVQRLQLLFKRGSRTIERGIL